MKYILFNILVFCCSHLLTIFYLKFYFNTFFFILFLDTEENANVESTIVQQIASSTFKIQKSKNYVYYRGFAYQAEKVRDQRSYYRCIESRSTSCKARLKVQAMPDDSKAYTQFRDHNHIIQR